MELKDKKILITGADGFIGSHLVERLVGSGMDVRAMSYYNSFGNCGWLDSFDKSIAGRFEVVSGDIRDPGFVHRAMQGVDVVFHLAALIAIPYSYVAPDSYIQTNVTGTLNVLQAARDAGIAKLIHTSTSEVYGTARYVPIDEAHPLQPQSPYSASKISADMLAMSYFYSFGVPVAIIRPFNTFGPRQSARAVIPTLITQVLASCGEIKLGSLSPKRDFNFVGNTVDGFIKVACSDKTCGEIVNVGSGMEFSIGEVVGKLREITGSDFVVVCDEQRVRPERSEVGRLLASNEKANELAGWKPEVPFDEGLRITVDWFRVNLHRYKHEVYNI